eukprot:scaffold14920_cov63-Cylindrotheca_fusiformis.AAC.5
MVLAIKNAIVRRRWLLYNALLSSFHPCATNTITVLAVAKEEDDDDEDRCNFPSNIVVVVDPISTLNDVVAFQSLHQ